MALGVFTSAGVAHLRVQREAEVSNVGDLLLYSLDDLEDIAREKGGIRQLLDEKWRKVYQAMHRAGCSQRQRCARHEGNFQQCRPSIATNRKWSKPTLCNSVLLSIPQQTALKSCSHSGGA